MSADRRRWWTSKRWWIAILLLAITAVGYLDRQALSFSARPIRDEFGLDNEDYGLITGAFLATYALGQILSGPLIDRLGTRRSLGWAAGWWSFATLIHAFCTGFASLLSARAFLGLAEGANLPAALKAVAEWFPPAERSMATGLITAGIGLGAIIAPPLIGLIVALLRLALGLRTAGARRFRLAVLLVPHLPRCRRTTPRSERTSAR